jgi:hypothetical protein
VVVVVWALLWCKTSCEVGKKHSVASGCIAVVVGAWRGHELYVLLSEIVGNEATRIFCDTPTDQARKLSFQCVFSLRKRAMVVVGACWSPILLLVVIYDLPDDFSSI